MADYQQNQIRMDGYEAKWRLKRMRIFGWEKVDEFNYKNGDVRYTMRRDVSDPCFPAWSRNEALIQTIEELEMALEDIQRTASELRETASRVSKKPEYRLSGIKAVFGIRSAEQKRRIRDEVAEVNAAYDAFRAEIASDLEFVSSLAEHHCASFIKAVKERPAEVHPCAERIERIVERYQADVDVDGHVSLDLESISYDFETKRLELKKFVPSGD